MQDQIQTKKITSFSANNRWLSNFWPVKVLLDGVMYPSVENAYQAAKTVFLPAREPFVLCTAGNSKRMGRRLPLRANWEEIKLDVMRDLIRQKFHFKNSLGQKLIRTGDIELIEGNTWGDTYWGVCNGQGENNLGKILMEQRAILSALNHSVVVRSNNDLLR